MTFRVRYFYFILTFPSVLFVAVSANRILRKNNYTVYDVGDYCEHEVIQLEKSSILSTAKLRGYRTSNVTDMYCYFTVLPPEGYGVIFHVKYFDLDFSLSDCSTGYLEISGADFHKKRLCEPHFQSTSFYIVGDADFVYYAPFLSQGEGFTIIATAYKRECLTRDDVYRCANTHCIWVGLVRDGINNCGDNSDEITPSTTRRPIRTTTERTTIPTTAIPVAKPPDVGILFLILVTFGSLMGFVLIIILCIYCYLKVLPRLKRRANMEVETTERWSNPELSTAHTMTHQSNEQPLTIPLSDDALILNDVPPRPSAPPAPDLQTPPPLYSYVMESPFRYPPCNPAPPPPTYSGQEFSDYSNTKLLRYNKSPLQTVDHRKL